MMAHKYAKIAFTEQVKQVQTEQHSRTGYASMEQGEDVNHLLSDYEANFIALRDSFYMASVSETRWPYVQHRGGPAGFMRVLGAKTIGFADYTGNRQYISTGNFSNNDRVSIIFMDYPNRTRMKLLGRVSIVTLDDAETLAKLEVADYRAPVERGFLIHVEAFDWNCPKYITPRYNNDEIQTLLKPLEQENQQLKQQLATIESNPGNTSTASNSASINVEPTDPYPTGSYPKKLGDGPLKLVISGIRQLTPDIRAYELRDVDGDELPQVVAGSHLQIPVQLPTGEQALRHYSICSNPQRRDIYEIAVLNEPDGRGGSHTIHQHFQLGLVLACQQPENHFSLRSALHQQGAPAVLVAGGIGITPIKAMAQSLRAQNFEFALHYAGKNNLSMAFQEKLQREFADSFNIYRSAEGQRLNISNVLTSAPANSIFYICGPSRLIDAFLEEAKIQNIVPQRICYERFTAAIDDTAAAITVTLNKSAITLEVSAQQSILDAMLDANIAAPYSCKAGECKTCAVKILEGTPKHLDNALSVAEQEQQGLMCPCVSRATSSHLTLDI
ncbi:2Fe-2S iron-sulfur cluster-binding protein [Thalassotalea sp. ND16A]|uniref:2Fe-2S iron-sulfur cluster-binding protein n=1 Tax=Thalassotalea sp. ND16A TaxID=1535422 RepID=UPI00051CCEC0|nr:2Fe-2S iron-sulfur cluster-binding protein [Thalassotalea sp. ND16A]KGJ87500.1 Phthalate 4,5-dioxygenase [Thalassotalea sp. ND16A]